MSMCLITGDADFGQFVLEVPAGFSTILLVFFSFYLFIFLIFISFSHFKLCLLTKSLHLAHIQREKN